MRYAVIHHKTATGCHKQAPHAYHRVGKRAFESLNGLSFARIVT